jgi:indolepyruvate ferredoxin oxidoreductase alpha subunit
MEVKVNVKKLMMGNEAVARGAYEAGCTFAAAYPGTPSTQIFENVAKYKEIYAEWATNEVVAAELVIGAQMAGARAMASMKHFGLNVASDPIFSNVYNGVNGGLIFVVADDPGLATSGTEPDSRRWGPHMKIPVIEPADSQESKDYVKEAFEISEHFDTPVLVRMTTRVSHGTGIVALGERQEVAIRPYVRDVRKNATMSSLGKHKHNKVEQRLLDLARFSDETELNRLEFGDRKIGVVANGISYHYAREIFGEGASYLKIGFSYPLPEQKLREFAQYVETLYVIEELDPYMEECLQRLGITCTGKNRIPRTLELSVDIIRDALGLPAAAKPYELGIEAPPRLPNFCSGCTHRGVYMTMQKHQKEVVACGDIGCYNLAVLPPFSVHETMQDMGGSIGTAISFWKVFKGIGRTEKPFAFIGDSTFFHSGMPPLADAVYRKANIVLFVLDNRSTAMTGHQDHVGTGRLFDKTETAIVNIEDIVRSMGIADERIRIVDPYDLAAVETAVREGIKADELFVVIARRPCPLLKETRLARAGIKCVVDQGKCKKCKSCIKKTGCPALAVLNGEIVIDQEDCVGCALCEQVCPFDAIDLSSGKEGNE